MTEPQEATSNTPRAFVTVAISRTTREEVREKRRIHSGKRAERKLPDVPLQEFYDAAILAGLDVLLKQLEVE